jgi:tRNA (guanine-N7-)-methyltransferase
VGCRNARYKIVKKAQISQEIDKSGLVTSSQSGIHPHLERNVRRHLQSTWLQPLHKPSVNAYRMLQNEGVFTSGQSFILDSGCGTGKSTLNLAVLFPEHNVIGVDQSWARLARGGVKSDLYRSGNCILLRAELTSLWRMLLNDRLSPDKHFILYPNPWPKSAHLARRWHGHPVFPQLLSLGGEIEMRCNWEIYALEFAQAIKLATGSDARIKVFEPEIGISLFEQKYLDRGQRLYSVTIPAKATLAFQRSQQSG